MPLKTLDDLQKDLGSLHRKRILVRLDLNVPFQNGQVLDTTRIDRARETIHFLQKQGANLLILSHLGRPQGAKKPAFSLEPLIPVLEKSWSSPLCFVPTCVGPDVQQALETCRQKHNPPVILLENVRFEAGEEKNDPSFAQALAQNADLYVNDAFSVSHRSHASVHALPQILPAYGGRLLVEEVRMLEKAFKTPQPPVIAIVSGSKVSTKFSLLNHIAAQVETLVVSGGIASTCLYALGHSIGTSLCEKDRVTEVQEIFKTAQKRGCQILLPQDVVITPDLSSAQVWSTLKVDQIPDDQMIVDLGPLSIAQIERCLERSRTVIWNGPLGVFEKPPFEQGTCQIAKKVAALTKAGSLISIAGGGETVAALHQAGVGNALTYLSTSGGAFLEFLQGLALPGIEALIASSKSINAVLKRNKDILKQA